MGYTCCTPTTLAAAATWATPLYASSPACAAGGIGRALVRHSLDTARELGYRAMQFNAVVSTNARAIALYEQMGFPTNRPGAGGIRLKDGSVGGYPAVSLRPVRRAQAPLPAAGRGLRPRDAIEACEQRTMLAWMGQQGDFILIDAASPTM